MEPWKKRQISLLVVENDPNYFYLLRKSLENHSSFSFRIDQAFEVPDAFQKLRKNSYQMLLVESRLKDRDGLDLLKEMREVHMDLPFVLMTDVRDDTLAREAIKHGVADLIIKNESQFHDLAALLDGSYTRYCMTHPRFALSEHGQREGTGERRSGAPEVPDVPLRPSGDESKYRDEVTGIYNHSYLHDRLATEFSAASRYNYPVSCVFIDLDHFKQINERNGFQTGDRLLKECGKLFFDNCRMSDIIARYGGEEFAVLMPHSDYAAALELADRLQKLFSARTFFPESEQIHLTVSIGVSSFPEDPIQKRFELVSFAKQAAVGAKVAGRNRVARYRDIMPTSMPDFPRLEISEDKIAYFQRRITEVSDLARRACLDASRALILTLDSKDKLTAGHSANTARYSAQVGELMGMTLDEIEILYHATLLHDIGKLCIPDEVLLKEGKLTFQEYEAMKQHPYLGYKILKPIKLLQEEAVLVLHHHEWYNGKGYPSQLKGNEIPLGARIIAVIDTFDTIKAAGARYKKTSSVIDCVNELISCSGTQFDPIVVKAFIEVLKKRGEIRPDDYRKNDLEVHIKSAMAAA
jgi:diguanylate cyclase (GGDEF)-like protein